MNLLRKIKKKILIHNNLKNKNIFIIFIIFYMGVNISKNMESSTMITLKKKDSRRWKDEKCSSWK